MVGETPTSASGGPTPAPGGPTPAPGAPAAAPGTSDGVTDTVLGGGGSGETGGKNPFPGSVTIISVTTPLPLIFLGQGGGIRIAPTPMGFSSHDFPEPARRSETFLLISTEAKQDFLEILYLVY
jgi:hypothetical protein